MCPNLPKRGWKNNRPSNTHQNITYQDNRHRVKPHTVSYPKTQSTNGTIILILIIIGISVIIYTQYKPSIGGIESYVEGVTDEIKEGYEEVIEVAEEGYHELIDVTKAPPPLDPFPSIDELIQFLDRDNVSDVVYASDFKCGDFAEALVNRAQDAGYELKVASMWDSELDDFIQYVESLEYTTKSGTTTFTTTFSYGSGEGHALCRVIIDSSTYLIEPQNDMVFEILGTGYNVVYFGAVTK
jgi:hypothetical protein